MENEWIEEIEEIAASDRWEQAQARRRRLRKEVRGIIEWYDRNCIKVNRENGDANLMIYKPAIKYMFKEGENQK